MEDEKQEIYGFQCIRGYFGKLLIFLHDTYFGRKILSYPALSEYDYIRNYAKKESFRQGTSQGSKTLKVKGPYDANGYQIKIFQLSPDNVKDRTLIFVCR